MTTDYLAAALTRALSATGTADAEELLAQLGDYYEGSATRAEVERELDLLERAGAIESFYAEDGSRWYRDAD